MANRLPRRQWMVGKDRGQDKEQNTSGGVAQLRRDRRRWWWIEPRFFWSKSPVFWPFPATWTAGKRRPSSKLQISTLLGRWHGRKWERQPSRIHGFRSTRFSFPSLPVSFFFFFLFLSLCGGVLEQNQKWHLNPAIVFHHPYQKETRTILYQYFFYKKYRFELKHYTNWVLLHLQKATR